LTRLSKTTWLAGAVILACLSPKDAMAVELSRPDLMTLARQFVDRIGQKLQGGDSVRSNLDQIPDGELLLLQPRLPNNVLVAASVAGLTQNSKLFLSFREFCDGLAFPIDVNTEPPRHPDGI
jgi:hypothetical protein